MAREDNFMLVSIEYINHENKYTYREIKPINIWFGKTEWHPEDQWFLKAHDKEKDAERDFAVKDIQYWEPIDIRESATETLVTVDKPSQMREDLLEHEPEDGWMIIYSRPDGWWVAGKGWDDKEQCEIDAENHNWNGGSFKVVPSSQTEENGMPIIAGYRDNENA